MPKFATNMVEAQPSELINEGLKVPKEIEECFSSEFKNVKKSFASMLKKKLASGEGNVSDMVMAVRELARIDKMQKTGSYY